MTNAELAILSLIAQQSRHGYEIEQVIEERGMREWTEVGFSSIYYLLKKLERKGFITGRLEAGERGPARKVYYITSTGEEAVYAGGLDALMVPCRGYHQLMLGLAMLPRIEPIEALAALRAYQSALIERRGEVYANCERQQPLPYFVEAMFDYTVTLLDAETAWVDKFIQQLTHEHKESDDGQD